MSAMLEFRIDQAVWLFPVCIAVHFLEEAPAFATWAQRHISRLYTEAHWRRVHTTGAVAALVAAASVSAFPEPLSMFLFTAIFLAPMVFNAAFHVAASVICRSYSPGTASAVLLFPGLCAYLVWLACEARMMNVVSTMAAVMIGAVFHALDLAVTTFFVKLTPRPMVADRRE
jgi:hypothetical protein